jgi:hypothetical protein
VAAPTSGRGPGDWFISYTEEDGCSIPHLEPLKVSRRVFPGWPYRCGWLKQLGVEFRIVRRLEEGPPVSQWFQETDEAMGTAFEGGL